MNYLKKILRLIKEEKSLMLITAKIFNHLFWLCSQKFLFVRHLILNTRIILLC